MGYNRTEILLWSFFLPKTTERKLCDRQAHSVELTEVDRTAAQTLLEERLLAQVPVWLLQNRGDAASAALCRDTLMEAQT